MLRYLVDAEILPEEPKSAGRRALYARDLNVLRDGLAMRLAGALTAMISNARTTSYWEQERRTVDGAVKRAVSEALVHMEHLLLDMPYTPPPVTMETVSQMAADISVGIYELKMLKIGELIHDALRNCGGAPGECTDKEHSLAYQIQRILEENPVPKTIGAH